MSIEIRRYTENFVPCVREFNDRLETYGANVRFPERHVPKRSTPANGQIYQEYFLAIENTSTVRGGYVLQHQEFSFKGEVVPIAFYQFPLSEGIVNKEYSLIGVQLLTNALKRQPLLFALGMGGFDAPLPRMLAMMGWRLHAIPFYFRVNRPFRFLKNVTPLRRTRLRRILANIMATTGLGWSGIRLLQASSAKRGFNRMSPVAETVDSFADWSDDLWTLCKTRYSMAAVRDRQVINTLYPRDDKKFLRLKVTEDKKVSGWAVVLDTQMTDHKYFGNLRVGTIVDCMAVPDCAGTVIAATAKFLETRGVDLMVSNQSHAAWGSALRKNGFLKGPSNFIFAASKALSRRLEPFAVNKDSIHLNRGDGDGPIHL